MVKTRHSRRLEAESLGLSSPEPANIDMNKNPAQVLLPRRSPRSRTNLSTSEPPSPGSDIQNTSLRHSSSSTLRDNEPVEISTSDSEGSTSASNPSYSTSASNLSDSTYTKPAFCSFQRPQYSPTALSDSSNGETSGEPSVSSSDDQQHSDDSDDQSLPKRLFATDRYPTDGRVNSYSKPQYLLDILSALRGTPELHRLKNSPFGSLFDLPVRRCSLSGKLLHNVLSRQILTTNDDELWFTFGGSPLRFSLVEFERVTRLPCGPYPDKDTVDAAQTPAPGASPYWNTLIGRDKKDVSIKSIVNKLKSERGIPGWKKIRLARGMFLIFAHLPSEGYTTISCLFARFGNVSQLESIGNVVCRHLHIFRPLRKRLFSNIMILETIPKCLGNDCNLQRRCLNCFIYWFIIKFNAVL